jgi:type III secretion protein S
MDYDNIVRLTSEAMLMCLMVSLPVVAVSAVVGLLVSFLQAITSLQDQSISQGAKLIAVVITLVVAAPWGAAVVLRFAQSLLKAALV